MNMDDGRAVATARDPQTRSWLTSGWRLTAVAIGAGLLVLAAGAWLESVIIAAAHATDHELEWISDVVASAAVTTLTYLWLNLRATRARLLDLQRAQIALDEQLRLAAVIQRSLLPAIPRATPGYLWAARMVPAYEVGGDFYDFVTRDDGAVLFILGDVSGKGIPAALLQSSLKTLFRVHATASVAPEVIAARMSDGLREETGGVPYATAIVACLDRSPRRISYVNAGHPAGIVLRGVGRFALESGGPPLGLLPDPRYERGSVDLLPHDLGVFVTDGITEALDGAPVSFRAALEDPAVSRSMAPEEICDRLLRMAGKGHGPPGAGTWHDDRTAFAFRVRDDEELERHD